jgi:RNA polymerase sigma-70 factor (ECF subfamily)
VDRDDDQALVERWQGGDREALGQLVERYQRPVYNAAFRMLGNADDAADATQAVFLKIAQHAEDYDPRFRFFSWLYRIAVNESLNMLRGRGREEPLEDDTDLPGAPNANPEAQLGEAQLARHVQAALMKMKAQDRAVLTLRHFSECSYEEIGEILDLDEKTVKSRLFEARGRLRKQLGYLRTDGK